MEYTQFFGSMVGIAPRMLARARDFTTPGGVPCRAVEYLVLVPQLFSSKGRWTILYYDEGAVDGKPDMQGELPFDDADDFVKEKVAEGYNESVPGMDPID